MKKDYFSWKDGQYYSTQYDTTQIVDTEELNNETYYVTNKREVVIDRTDGYWSNNGTVQEAKYPGEVGNKFFSYKKITNEHPPDTVTGYWEILSKNDTVTVPAGTFSCYKYRLEGIGTSGRLHLRTFAWWSPGFGLIKTENYYPNESGNLILIGKGELVKEDLK